MSERIRGSYDDALYKSTFTLLYFSVGQTTPKITTSRGQVVTPSRIWLLWSTQPPNGISIGSAVFVQHTRLPITQTDRQTHRQTVYLQ